MTPGSRERRSTRAAFFVAGVGMAAWAPLVPFAKARLMLPDSTLGLLLLCLGAGSMVTMPAAGALAARYGCRRVICVAGSLLCVALPLLATAPSLPLMAASVLLFGASVGTVDVVMNIQAVLVEQASGRAMMSGFHGLFSAGGIAGAAGVSLVLWLTGSPLLATLCVDALIVLMLVLFGPALLPTGGDRDGPPFAVPRGAVLLVAALCFISFLAEGAMLDWSALILTSLHGTDPAQAGLGFAVFSVMMTAGRFRGDRIVHALGGPRVLLWSGLAASAGLVAAVLAPSGWGALAGFGLVGLGASNIVPVLFSALGRQRAMPPNLAISAVTTVGYGGILLGPAAIGAVAQAAGLTVAILGVAGLLLGVAAGARAVSREPVRAG